MTRLEKALMGKHNDMDATREDRWLVLIIPLYNETPNTNSSAPGWLSTTSVEHRAGGKITLRSSGRPACGRQEHERQYRAAHPELEPFHRENQRIAPRANR